MTESTPNLVRKDFNDIASSVVVTMGTWKLWEHVDYKGKFFVVTPGKYNISEIREKIGNDVISSVELCNGKHLNNIVQGWPDHCLVDFIFLLEVYCVCLPHVHDSVYDQKL